MSTERTKPVQEIRLGRIKSSIWLVEGSKGRFFNTSVVRLYKEGVSWRESTTFGRDDLPLVAKVSDLSWLWILTHAQECNASSKEEPTSSTTTTSCKFVQPAAKPAATAVD